MEEWGSNAPAALDTQPTCAILDLYKSLALLCLRRNGLIYETQAE